MRPHYARFKSWLDGQGNDAIADKRTESELIFRRVGITFAVYGDLDDGGSGTERTIPFDIIPRIIPASDWRTLQAGLRQRVTALNRFIHDVYHDQDILKAGIVPAERILGNSQYRPEMKGVDVPNDIYAHIAGIDVVRVGNAAGEGEFFVLEDNLRVPSGVSYMLENRKMMMRLFPDLFAQNRVAPVAHYPDLLLDSLRAVAPKGVTNPTVVVMTPGMYNSAYFEHAFLAQQMGVELVEGPDLFVEDDQVFMRTTQGPQRVDVIYRRIDDDFLDPLAFRADSALGTQGPAARVPGRQRHARERDRHRHRRRQVDLSVRAGHDPVLSRRGRDPVERADVPVPQARGPRVHARASAGAGRQGDPRRRRLRHAGRSGVDDRTRSRTFRARAGRASPTSTSRSRRSRCRRVRPTSTPASRRATSTCGRSCCPGTA